MNPSEQCQHIAQTFNLYTSTMGVLEKRSLKIPDGKYQVTASGYFDSQSKDAFLEAARECARLKAQGIYVTINPANSALHARCANHVKMKPEHTTTDADIVCRRRMLLDFDAKRPAGISSTNAEHDAALAKARECRDFLHESHGIICVLADSGNGAHLILAIDLPNDEDSKNLIVAFLKAIAEEFDDDMIHVDQSVFNAARISKIYGTMARKGDNTPERPHRYAKLLDVPADLPPVSIEVLRAIAGLDNPKPDSTTTKPTRGTTARTASALTAFDVPAYLAQHGIAVRNESNGKGDWHHYNLEACPFDASHQYPDSIIAQNAAGAIKFKCLHDSCQSKSWHDVRKKFEPGWTPYDPTRPNPARRAQTQRKAATANSESGEEGQKETNATEDGSALPLIETNNVPLRDQCDAALAAVIATNYPHPHTYVRNNRLVRVASDEDGRPSAQTMNPDMMRGVLARVADFVSTSEKRGCVNVSPPQNVVADILTRPEWKELPALAGIVTAPVFASDGTLCDTPGYHAVSRLYHHQAEGFELPNTTPTSENVEAALYLLRTELLGDFPFANAASEANTLGLLVLPFVRYLIRGATPLHLINSPAAGTGKGLLADACSLAFLPQGLPIMTAPVREEDWEKKLLATLLPAPSHVLIDNCRILDSANLDAALTAPNTWTGRILGLSENGTVPVRCVWIATANNLQVKGDLARRIIFIHIDSGEEKPYERSNFRHKDLREWIMQNRSKIVGACLTLVRAWQAAGSPPYVGKAKKGSYESWLSIIGGILETVGITDFLGNGVEAEEQVDPQTAAWRAFLHDWYTGRALQKAADPKFPLACTAYDALTFAEEHLMDDLGEKEGKARTVRMGRLLNERTGRVFGEYRIKRAGIAHKTGLYLVEHIKGGEGETGESVEADAQEYQGKQQKDNTDTPTSRPPHTPPSPPSPPFAGNSEFTHDLLAMIEAAKAQKAIPAGTRVVLREDPRLVTDDFNMRVLQYANGYQRAVECGDEGTQRAQLDLLNLCLAAWEKYKGEVEEEF